MHEYNAIEVANGIMSRGSVIVNVLAWYDVDLPLRPSRVEFIGDGGSFSVTAHGEDDTVRLEESYSAPDQDLKQGHEFKALKHLLVGASVAWIRIMLNQHGYEDGAQMDFAQTGGKSIRVLLVAGGSSLYVGLAQEIPRYPGAANPE